jgi:hypothetical protein
MGNKIGFSNFKSFGGKVQTFSQKPITLIYGPNSIGKSSTLHFLLYMEYLKETGKVDLEVSHFAGDPIDLGGFKNFIHKKDDKRRVNFQLTLQDDSDIEKYFTPLYTKVKNFEKEGAFNHEISPEHLIERIKLFRKKGNSSPFVYPHEIRAYKLEKALRYLGIRNSDSKETIQLDFVNFIIRNEDDLPNSESEQKAIFERCLTSEIPLEKLVRRNDNKPLDGLDKLIFFIIENGDIIFSFFRWSEIEGLIKKAGDSERRILELRKDDALKYLEKKANVIWKSYKLLSSINAIKRIKINFEFGINRTQPSYLLRYFIDNELLYSYKSDTDNFEENEDNKLLKEIIEFETQGSQSNIDNKKIGTSDFLDSRDSNQVMFQFLQTALNEILKALPKNIFLFNQLSHSFICSLHEHVIRAMKNSDMMKKSQYLGPIRFLPARGNKYEINSNSMKEILSVPRFKIPQKLLEFFMKHPSIRKILNQKFFRAILRIISLFYYFRTIKYLIFSDKIVVESINVFRKNRNKINSYNSMNSEQFWGNFANSPDKQKKVNDWLSDDTKLKTPYRIQIRQTEKLKRLRKLFRLKSSFKNELVFIDKRTDTEVTPRDMGLGISQVLPILISTLTFENHKIFIEQPELHLHPAVQCEIADEFIKSKNTQNNEFIIESHSEHLLLRMMKRMRQTAEGTITKDDELALTPEDVCLLYVDHNGEMTYLNELELDEDGSLLDPWPHGFFEEGYNERFG